MRTILVTGGAGFIGSNFVEFWLSTFPDDKIILVDSLTYAASSHELSRFKVHPQITLIQADIREQKLITRTIVQQHVSIIFHFAAETHVDRSIHDPEVFIQSNVVGTFSMLEAAKTAWGENLENKRFIHISTDEVFGSLGALDPAFNENTPYRPNSPYAASKASSDHLVRAYHSTYGLPVNIANCTNNFGPKQFPEKLIPLAINRAIENRPIPIYGNGKQIRDWIFVEVHCRALKAILELGANGEQYVIGARNELSNLDLIDLLRKIIEEKLYGSRKLKTTVEFVEDRPGHDVRYAVDPSKIEQALHWKPEWNFLDAISKTVDWYLETAISRGDVHP